jgi:hypothetical protein
MAQDVTRHRRVSPPLESLDSSLRLLNTVDTALYGFFVAPKSEGTSRIDRDCRQAISRGC